MTVYVVLFRGVGGATQLPTRPLREALTAAGYTDVATYINSGNAVVSSPKAAASVKAEIAAVARKEFGFDKDIHLVSREDWSRHIANNPFTGAVETPTFLHVAILSGVPLNEKLAALRAIARPDEAIEVIGTVAYLHTPGGVSQSRLGMKFDKGIGVPNTARNWNTMLALQKLADAIG